MTYLGFLVASVNWQVASRRTLSPQNSFNFSISSNSSTKIKVKSF